MFFSTENLKIIVLLHIYKVHIHKSDIYLNKYEHFYNQSRTKVVQQDTSYQKFFENKE